MDVGECYILEYARVNGLSQDYRNYSLLHHVKCLQASQQSHTAFRAFNINSELPGIVAPRLELEEKWNIDNAAARVLQQLLQPDAAQQCDAWEDARAIRGFRIPIPMLKTDDDLDYCSFMAGHQAMALSLSSAVQHLTTEDRPQNNTLVWPLHDETTFDRMRADIHNEKWQARRSAIELLKELLDPAVQAKSEDDEDQISSVTRLSPPVLPLSPSPSYDDGDDDYEIPFTSTPTDPAIDELQRMDTRILGGTIETGQSREPSFTTSSKSPTMIEPADSSSPAKRTRPEDFKLETPLTPYDNLSSPFKKVKLEDAIPGAAAAFTDHLSSPTTADAEYLKTFEEFIDLAAPAISAIENEQLERPDSTCRMPVPDIRHLATVPPWKMNAKAARTSGRCSSSLSFWRTLLRDTKESLASSELSWSVSGCSRDLRWVPVPYESCKDVVKDDVDEGNFERYNDKFGLDDVDLDCFIWKKDGLRVLDHEEDDSDDLAPMPIDIDVSDIETIAAHRIHKQAPNQVIKERPESQIPEKHLQPPQLGSLSDFITMDRFFAIQQGTNLPTMPSAPPATTKPPAATPINPPTKLTPPEPQPSPPAHAIPHPAIDLSTAPAQLILSPSILPSRTLLAALAAYLPTTTILERDLDPANDADIYASSGTALVLTTLQRLKQRPLPGSRIADSGAGGTAVHARLLAVAARAERVVVLVGEGQPAPSEGIAVMPRRLDASDAAALNELSSFAVGLETSVRVMYVPGSEKEIAGWVAGEVCRAGLGNGQAEAMLGEEESVQEAFLRSVGMNAFAAGMVLSVLKEEKGSGGHGRALAAFIAMGPGRRTERFGSLLGGTRVLGRIREVLDRRWIAAGADCSQDFRGYNAGSVHSEPDLLF